MIELSSVSKPSPSPFESAHISQTVRRVCDGANGAEANAVSRAEKAFVVIGKSDARIQRRFRRPSSSLETVIGTDDRERVLETEFTPWRMIAALRMFATNGGGAIGTGWLAGPRTIVTAGHCVHHMAFFGGWADRIEISAGRNGDNLPFGTISATRFSSVDRWVDGADADFDIGCIHLDEPLGDRVGWFSFASLEPTVMTNHLINISGYPADRGNGEEQYFHANRVLSVGERRIFYDVDTFGGQSGAPVWVHESQGAPPLVIGIHAYGTGGTPFDLGITANSAPRIIPEVFDKIVDWIKADIEAAGTP